MCKLSIEDDQQVDYIYCLSYDFPDAVKTNFKPLEFTDTTVKCNLAKTQRSSQQILDLADYLWMHQSYFLTAISRYESSSSFSSEIPLWIELTSPKSFFDYFTDKFKSSNDLMLIWDNNNKPSNINDIEEFCR